MAGGDEFTIGVEEEYQILDPVTRQLRPRAESILSRSHGHGEAEIQAEMHLSQIEIATPVCRSLQNVRAELVRLRREVIASAAADGHVIASAGTHPFSRWDEQQITPRERYLALEHDYQQVARETVCFSYHVHVGIRDRDLAIQTMNRTRPWIATILALGANSPFWLDRDTGYASFRTEVARRWPTAGVHEVFKSRADYDRLLEGLVATGSIEDASNIYWDVRPSAHAETIEFRVTDVCLSVDEAVMVAGLCRAVARTCHDQALRDEPVDHPRSELLISAKWRAARHGLASSLVDIARGCASPAAVVVRGLLSFARPALEEAGEWDEVSSLVERTIARGTGADRQRRAFERRGRLEDVVDMVVRETADI
ncbi:glutamate--cysteine ligase [soil metagenome]